MRTAADPPRSRPVLCSARCLAGPPGPARPLDHTTIDQPQGAAMISRPSRFKRPGRQAIVIGGGLQALRFGAGVGASRDGNASGLRHVPPRCSAATLRSAGPEYEWPGPGLLAHAGLAHLHMGIAGPRQAAPGQSSAGRHRPAGRALVLRMTRPIQQPRDAPAGSSAAEGVPRGCPFECAAPEPRQSRATPHQAEGAIWSARLLSGGASVGLWQR